MPMSNEQKALLQRLYDEQPLTLDELQHTEEFLGKGGFCEQFNAQETAKGREPQTPHDIYKALLLLRKNRQLGTKTGRHGEKNVTDET